MPSRGRTSPRFPSGWPTTCACRPPTSRRVACRQTDPPRWGRGRRTTRMHRRRGTRPRAPRRRRRSRRVGQWLRCWSSRRCPRRRSARCRAPRPRRARGEARRRKAVAGRRSVATGPQSDRGRVRPRPSGSSGEPPRWRRYARAADSAARRATGRLPAARTPAAGPLPARPGWRPSRRWTAHPACRREARTARRPTAARPPQAGCR